MNRYIASTLIFIFFSFAFSTVLIGLIDLFAYLFNFSEKFIQFLGFASLVISLYLGIYLAARRIKTNKPWNLTLLHKLIIFVFIFVAIQIIVESLLYIIFARALFGGAALPPMFVIYFLGISKNVTHFPLSLITEHSTGPWMEHLHFILLFINSILWASLLYSLLRIVKILKSSKIKPETGKHAGE